MILLKLFDGIFLSAEEDSRGCAGCAHKQQRCPQSHTGIISGLGDIGVDRSNGRPERGDGNIGFDGDLVTCLVFLGADLPTLEDLAGRSGETVGAELMLIRPIYIPFYYFNVSERAAGFISGRTGRSGGFVLCAFGSGHIAVKENIIAGCDLQAILLEIEVRFFLLSDGLQLTL